MSIIKKTELRGVSLNIVLFGLQSLQVAVLIWLIGHYWGLEALGLYTLISIFYTIIANAGTIGLTEFCLDSINQARKFSETKKNLCYSIYFSFSVGILITVFLFLLFEIAPPISQDPKIVNSTAAIKYLLLFVPLILINRLFQAIFLGKGDFVIATVLPVLRTSCLLGIGFYFIFFEDFRLDLIPLIFGLSDLATSIVSMSCGWKLLAVRLNYSDAREFFRAYISTPKLALIYQSMTAVYIKLDVIVAWLFFPLSDLGKYAFIAIFGEMLAQIGIVIRNVSFKFISDTHGVLERCDFEKFLIRLRLYSFGCCLMISIVLISFVIYLSEFLPVVIWPTYMGPLIFCCLWGSVFSAWISVDYSLMISGRFLEQTNLILLSLCISTIVVGFGAHVWGLSAIPIAMLIGTCLGLIVHMSKTNPKSVVDLW